MRKLFVVVTALLVLLCTQSAMAEQYSVSFGTAYLQANAPDGPQHCIWTIDFGRQFDHIETVTLNWTGSRGVVAAGMYGVDFKVSAGLKNTADDQSAYALGQADGFVVTSTSDGYVWYGSSPFSFSETINGPVDCLSDGKAVIVFNMWRDQEPGYGSYSYNASISSAQLVINTTPVPEPSSLAALIGGIGLLGGCITRRRK